MVIGVKNHGQRNLRRRATKFTPTGNKIYANGQQNLRQRATKFTPTGNKIYANGQRKLRQRAMKITQIPLFFAKGEHIVFLFRAYRFSFFVCVYIYAYQKKKINI